MPDNMIEGLSADTMKKLQELSTARHVNLEDYDQHALRYRGVIELAWADCDDDQIASYCGHTSKAMIIKYAGEARQIMRALQAAAKRK